MARRRRNPTTPPRPADPSPPSAVHPTVDSRKPARRWTRIRVGAAVVLLLSIHLTLAVRSLVRENPTVDEVAHLPAGVTYWETGSFRLYHHNPPLVKLVAALPVVFSRPETAPLYEMSSWKDDAPSPPTFSQNFALLNARRYFEIFTLARLLMPWFSVLGGLVVFVWSARLYGAWGGLLSLALWCFCPNVLAHARLVTSDLGATALGVGATYVFWRYLHAPGWRRALLCGVCLGLAELSKFSLILLYILWPFLWLVRIAFERARGGWRRRIGIATLHGTLIVVTSVVTIDAGYFFEGLGIPLGKYEFASATMTRPVTPGTPRPTSRNPLLDLAWKFRVNRFRGTLLGEMPAPLPRHYLLGFDEQKLESEGVPTEWFRNPASPGPAAGGEKRAQGYSVYLDGELRKSGWWYYYLFALAYKVPEGTWCLVLASVAVTFVSRRSRADWADEIAIGTVPVTTLFTMSVLTDINLGLRYVLPIAPYAFIGAGKLVPWAEGLGGWRRSLARAFLALSLGSTVLATTLISPHYLAYFNWASGGPDRIPARLIDSNLDWGQDLVNLKEWLDRQAPGERVGLAYFGQINPSIFALRNEPLDWFLPPVEPGTTRLMPGHAPRDLVGPAARLTPGLYAVSASLVYGLPWRLYDPSPSIEAWSPSWNASEPDAFGYFRSLKPFARIGHSILLYRVTPLDARKISSRWQGQKPPEG